MPKDIKAKREDAEVLVSRLFVAIFIIFVLFVVVSLCTICISLFNVPLAPWLECVHCYGWECLAYLLALSSGSFLFIGIKAHLWVERGPLDHIHFSHLQLDDISVKGRGKSR